MSHVAPSVLIRMHLLFYEIVWFLNYDNIDKIKVDINDFLKFINLITINLNFIIQTLKKMST